MVNVSQTHTFHLLSCTRSLTLQISNLENHLKIFLCDHCFKYLFTCGSYHKQKAAIYLFNGYIIALRANCAPVCVCLHLALARWHTIQPHMPSRQLTSSNGPFEVELDELCCIKQNKSSMCFYRDIPHTTKTSTGHLRWYKWACDDDSVYKMSVPVCVCVVTVPGTLRPISRSHRCYLTEPTQTLFSSFPSSSLLFCLVSLAGKRPWRSLTKQVGNTL